MFSTSPVCFHLSPLPLSLLSLHPPCARSQLALLRTIKLVVDPVKLIRELDNDWAISVDRSTDFSIFSDTGTGILMEMRLVRPIDERASVWYTNHCTTVMELNDLVASEMVPALAFVMEHVLPLLQDIELGGESGM